EGKEFCKGLRLCFNQVLVSPHRLREILVVQDSPYFFITITKGILQRFYSISKQSSQKCVSDRR
ncbi:hypothetical protein, partial [Neisseria meningitidis]|uniref:hypothetical protein n=1 Tax=Neisseria meningitidis TaxID=487 RepID=UPI0009A4ABC8